MRTNGNGFTTSLSREGIAGFLLGIGFGTFVGLLLRPPKVRSGRPAPVRMRDKVDIASEESFPASDAPAY